jgi:hypothetical protein
MQNDGQIENSTSAAPILYGVIAIWLPDTLASARKSHKCIYRLIIMLSVSDSIFSKPLITYCYA